MSFDQASFILAQHGHDYRSSQLPGHIQGRVEWINRDGSTGADWEDIKMVPSAIRDWLGY